MTIWAIIPVKEGAESKSRLAHLLSAAQRAQLIRDFLANTLAVLNELPAIARILVVSRDPAVLALARRCGACTLFEKGVPGLNSAVTQGVDYAAAEGATATLILPADLPFVQVADIETMLRAFLMAGNPENGGRPSPSRMVICADSKNEGSNALLLSLPSNFTFQYGIDSFHRHLQEAGRLGIRADVANAPGLRFDLDTEEDYFIYRKQQVSGVQVLKCALEHLTPEHLTP